MAGASTNVSSGSTDNTARTARAESAPSSRNSLPSTVARATESAGKFASQMTTSSPCPIARSAWSTSALSSGSRFFSTLSPPFYGRACHRSAVSSIAVRYPDVFHLHGLPQERQAFARPVEPIETPPMIDERPLQVADRFAFDKSGFVRQAEAP